MLGLTENGTRPPVIRKLKKKKLVLQNAFPTQANLVNLTAVTVLLCATIYNLAKIPAVEQQLIPA